MVFINTGEEMMELKQSYIPELDLSRFRSAIMENGEGEFDSIRLYETFDPIYTDEAQVWELDPVEGIFYRVSDF